MYNFEVIENHNPKWREIITKADAYDFHHTAYFHKIDTDFPKLLLCFYNELDFIALPVLKRPIQGTSFFDLTSVYGYAGPIFHFSSLENKQKLIDFFKESFKNYCKENKIVSVFARLHPLINQSEILRGLGDIVELNKTICIDLTVPAEEQRKQYRKSLKSELNQLRRKGIIIKEAESKEEIDQFIEIYYETMERVQASSSYYFSKKYFYEFLHNSDFKANLLIAVNNGLVIAGAIFTFTKKIMQYHLAGTTEKFISEAPMKLILDEARLLGNQSNVECLHLGGGVGGSDDDSLFKFKSAFSKKFHQFAVWKYVFNEEIYNNLSIGKESSQFFPLYRS
ncbi:GNAT family N-acetyltransferase [Cloacibacterium normanense]|uniref:GNAT family N-acetyltransferase n=1 Tax=Cloacibacterium normanense TaxID=237258 RepID=UPI0035B362CB